uniref:Uncharacterized protein n=1 Tax=Ditylenchus dipsaci TaxID=166011 RepID=A0A915DMH4_9BILA
MSGTVVTAITLLTSVARREKQFIHPIVIIKLLKQMLSACFIWLTDFNKISTPRKLVLAQDYQLTELQELCFKKFKSLEEIKRLQLTKEYATLKTILSAAL